MECLFAVALVLVWPFGSLVAVSQTSGSMPETGTTYVSASETAPGHWDLLDKRKTDLAFSLNLYNYDWRKSWDPKELQSPVAKNYAIFRFQYVGLSEGREICTVFIPLSGGNIRIIPLSYGMIGPAHTTEDPHNIAIFNEVVSRGQPAIRSDADRLNLAILYLHFFYEDPMVLDKENLDAYVGAHRKTSARLAPSVTTKTDGAFDIELVQKESKHGPFSKISFSFDKQGMMRNFDEEKISISELLNGQ